MEKTENKKFIANIDKNLLDQRNTELKDIVAEFKQGKIEKLDWFLKACFKDINRTRALTHFISSKDVKISSEIEKLIIIRNFPQLKEKVISFLAKIES